MAATPIDLSNAVRKALEDIYRKKVNPDTEIQPDIFRGFLDTFDLAASEGLKDKPDVGYDFRRQILHNNEVFSAFKVHRMQNDIAAKMLDDKGELKTFAQFAEDVKGITSHQCRQWLRTEYDTAVKRAAQAADWRRFEDEKDVLPNLRWVPSTAANPEPFHESLWDTVLPVDHPFWSRHRPGDHWGCQCSLEATDDPAKATPTPGAPASPGLDNNPGRDGKLFSDSHPYFPDDCRTCPFYGGAGNDRPTNRTKDCYHCPYIEKVIPGEKTEQGYGLKLKENILKTENEHRRDKDESAYAFDPVTGNIVYNSKGKGAKVTVDGVPENTILTHNHPRSLGKTGFDAIGNSFSREDITTAISRNVAEIRAVTPTYTFSLKRPESGWRISSREVGLRFNRIEQDIISEGNSYISEAKTSQDRQIRIHRCQIVHHHKVVKELAKEMGWTYSKKNS